MTNPSEAFWLLPLAAAMVRRFRQLPLEGDAGCDKLTDAEWRLVAEAAITAMQQAATPAAPRAICESCSRIFATPAAPVQDDDAELERLSRLNPMYEGHEEDSLGLNIRMHVRAVLAARLTPDRVTPLVEALRKAKAHIETLLSSDDDMPTASADYDEAEAFLVEIDTALRAGGFDA